ncbi:glycine hydroxymethyltransferase [Fulvimarina sp. 2208YS6-2-32]|uniref:Glycine hydroxymethyltransferase n=1 Tax=Fulvimarina uroteuthidis TaxID=3098149 RepID=A0ABU5I3Z7_9HYPH|nr:glycine hydroxymethyltransferase [Fulvimarina sp. 2208YS6-2-32]MDY8108891.1 glycine hydroxymethyltransferase [Fulvimarina sp. 2208YS6-2-32]
MTGTDRFDDLDGLSANAVKLALAGRIGAHARALQDDHVVLYAGANILTPSLRASFDPTISLMPAMGPPDDKEQPGSDLVASLEIFSSRLAARVFGAAFADCRLPSCTIANLAVFSAFVPRSALVLAPAAADGGHLSQRRGGTPSMLGLAVSDLPFDGLRQCLDAQAAAAMIRRDRPSLVVLGRSVILRPDDLEPAIAACRAVGALSLYDASHVAGLIAGGVFPNPLAAGVDLVTTSTYKTLAGPTGAIVMGQNPEHGRLFADFVDRTLLANQDAARLAPLCGVLAEFAEPGAYAARILHLAERLKRSLVDAGLPVLLAGEPARTHQVVVPIGDLGETKTVVADLERARILVGRCPVPGTPGRHGLRFGTQLLARTARPGLRTARPVRPSRDDPCSTTSRLIAAIEAFLD